MNKDKIAGAAKTVAGEAKEVTGKVLGNKKLAADGRIEKNSGKLQSAVGNIKDTIRNG